jgi:cytoskeletal protein CcmA (bactofilin family)
MPAGEAAAVIGKSVQIRGEVKGNEDLVIEGSVDGTISLPDNRLTIGVHAHVQANLTARDVVVLGGLVGDVQASGRVELRAGCAMTGDIHAGRLAVEENAVYSGKVELSGGSSASGGATEKTHSAAMHAAPAAAAGAQSGALFGAN